MTHSVYPSSTGMLLTITSNLNTRRHTSDGPRRSKSHLVDPLIQKEACVCVCQPAPAQLSQQFSSKKFTQRELQYFYWLYAF